MRLREARLYSRLSRFARIFTAEIITERNRSKNRGASDVQSVLREDDKMLNQFVLTKKKRNFSCCLQRLKTLQADSFNCRAQCHTSSASFMSPIHCFGSTHHDALFDLSIPLIFFLLHSKIQVAKVSAAIGVEFLLPLNKPLYQQCLQSTQQKPWLISKDFSTACKLQLQIFSSTVVQ